MDKFNPMSILYYAPPEEKDAIWRLFQEVTKFTKMLDDCCAESIENGGGRRIAGLTTYIGMMKQGLEQFIKIQKELFEKEN